MPSKTLREIDDETVGWWFSKHVASLQRADFDTGVAGIESRHPLVLRANEVPIYQIVWAQPDTWVNGIVYLFHGNYLFVCGDLGDAVYSWPENITAEWVAGLNLDYFGSKCQASSEEPKGKTWQPELVQEWIEERLARWASEHSYPVWEGAEGVGQPVWKDREPITFGQCVDWMSYSESITLEDVIQYPQTWAEFACAGPGLIVGDRPGVWSPRLRWQTAYRESKLNDGVTENSGGYPIEHLDSEQCSIGYTWDLRTRGHLTGLKMAVKQLREAAAAGQRHLDMINPCSKCGRRATTLKAAYCAGCGTPLTVNLDGLEG